MEFLWQGPNTHGSDTVAAAGQEQAHPVLWIQLPCLLRDLQQPAFGNQAVEKGKKTHILVGLRLEGQGKSHGRSGGAAQILLFGSVSIK